MNETLAGTIPGIIQQLLSSVHTAMPGKIESYNRSTFRAKVTPLLKHVTNKNAEIAYQAIEDVPVLVFGGSAGIIDVELQKGDNVILIFMESEIGGWKSSKGDKPVSPEDLSHHEINNAIALPCVVTDGQNFSNTPRIQMDKNGKITINGHFTVDP
jgi:hypothetical protein